MTMTYRRKVLATTAQELTALIASHNRAGKMQLVALDEASVADNTITNTTLATLRCTQCGNHSGYLARDLVVHPAKNLNQYCAQCRPAPAAATPAAGSKGYTIKGAYFANKKALLAHVRAKFDHHKQCQRLQLLEKERWLELQFNCTQCGNKKVVQPLNHLFRDGAVHCHYCASVKAAQLSDQLEHSRDGREFYDLFQLDGYRFATIEAAGSEYRVLPDGYDPQQAQSCHANGWHGADSKVLMECIECGYLLSRSAYYDLRSHLLLNKRPAIPCPACHDTAATYQQRTEELQQKLPGSKVEQWLDGWGKPIAHSKKTWQQRAVLSYAVQMQCDQGHRYQRPLSDIIKQGASCPECTGFHWHIKSLLRLAEHNPDELYKRRVLYWLTFVEIDTGERFWKIGLASSDNLSGRYPRANLQRDGVEIIEQKVLTCSNFEAIVTERTVLQQHQQQALDKRQRLVHSAGGTECFATDVLAGQSLAQVVQASLARPLLIDGQPVQVNFDPARAASLRRHKQPEPAISAYSADFTTNTEH
ncbi:hypothetical protein [uncultured Ferrimonas sp.]|uniref:hypothetical protein n=1 Tax=uncultured Ferrimonas sp. TaxID=432640 RepID=UPI00261F0B54|nr:hypothetical protein [uncultured Ferrimonas sp.]